jgi:UDP-glucose 4-epimerase
MDMTILVTGASGFVGKNIVNRLSHDPSLRIVAVDVGDMLVAAKGTNISSVTYVEGNLSSKDFNASLRESFHFDCIIHLAAVLSQAEDMNTYFAVMDSNIYTTFLLLETARAHGARFLFPSTALVYGNKKAPFTEDMSPNPEVFYALSKHMSEELIRFYATKYGLRYMIFRIGILYGPWQTEGMFIPSIVTKLLRNEEFAMTAGEQVRDFVHIDDFVAALMKALVAENVNGVFNVGTGCAPAMKEVAQTVERLTGATGKARLGALPYRENEVWEYRLDISKIRAELGWEPAVSLEEGLRKTIDYYRGSINTAHAGRMC